MKRNGLLFVLGFFAVWPVKGQLINTWYYEASCTSSPAGGTAIFTAVTDGSPSEVLLGSTLGLKSLNGRLQKFRTTYRASTCASSSETNYSGGTCSFGGYTNLSCNGTTFTIHSNIVLDNPVYIENTNISSYAGANNTITYSAYCYNPFNKAPGSYGYLQPRLQYQSGNGEWKDLPFTLFGSGGQIVFSPKNLFTAADLYNNISFRVLKTVGNNVTCETYGNIAGPFQFYDTVTLSIPDGIRLVCQNKSIRLSGGYRLFGTADVSAFLEARQRGTTSWTQLSKILNASTELYFSDLNNPSWLGKEIEIRAFKLFNGNKIAGNIERIMFLPAMNVQATVTPPSCYGMKNGKITLSFPERSPFNNQEVKILVTIVKYDLHPISEINTFYQPVAFPGDTATYYFYDAITFAANVPGTFLVVDSTVIQDPRFNLGAGKYSVNARFVDDTSCHQLLLLSMPEPEPLNASFSPENQWFDNNTAYQIRTGAERGNAILQMTGGTEPYTICPTGTTSYLSVTGHQATLSLAEGEHRYTIRDAHNCAVQSLITMKKPPDISISIAETDPVLCHSATEGDHGYGAVTVNVSGGVLPLHATVKQYGNAIFSQKITTRGTITITSGNLTAGNGYEVSVQDTTVDPANPWQAVSGSFAITEPPDILLDCAVQPALCHDDKAILHIQATGGTGYLTCTLNDSIPVSGNVRSVESGISCQIKATDANGCRKSISVVVPPAPPALVLYDSVINVSCSGAGNGMITLFPQGGTPFAGQKYDIGMPVKGITERLPLKIFTGLSPGNYYLTVTDSNGCVAEKITEVKLSGKPLRLTAVTIGPASCFAVPDGRINVVFEPGERPFPPYRLRTENSSGYKEELLSTVDTSMVTGLRAGAYALTLTDYAGCMVSESFTVPVRSDSLRISQMETTPVLCPGTATGKIIVSARFGVSADGLYRFALFSLPQQLLMKEMSDTSATFELLESGSYLVKIMDAAGCSATETQTITSLPTPVHFTLHQLKDQSCEGVANGIIRISASSLPQNGRLAYSLVPETVFRRYADTLVATHLVAGNYSITVTDSAGCRNDTLVAVKNLGNEPQFVLVGIDSAACREASNGRFFFSVRQKVADSLYTMYLLSPGRRDTFTVHAEYSEAANLCAGTYGAIVTDREGCSGSAQVEIPLKKDSLHIDKIFQQEASCRRASDAILTIRAGGGIPARSGYRFVLDGSAEKHGREVSFSSLKPQKTYRISVYDSAGCNVSTNQEMAARTDTLKALIAGITNTRCYGSSDGSLRVKSQNGRTGPEGYKYRLFREGVFVSEVKAGESFEAGGLSAGRYRIDVSDSTVCSFVTEASIVQPDSFSVAIFPGYAKEKGKPATPTWFEITGGTVPYLLHLSDEEEKEVRRLFTSRTAVADSLLTGRYVATITDSAGCRSQETNSAAWNFQVLEPEQDLKVIVSKVIPATCSGSYDGAIEVMAAGGWGRKYLFGIGSKGYRDSAWFGNLPAGEYTVFVQDTAGIIASAPVSIPQPEALAVSIDSLVNPTCDNRRDGKVFLTIRGGTAPYFVKADSLPWMPENVLSDLGKGPKEIHVKDAHGCLSEPLATELFAPPPLLLEESHITSPLCGRNDGKIAAEITGGTPDYTFLWTGENGFESTSRDAVNISGGHYSLLVSDRYQCQAIFYFEVSDSGGITINRSVVQLVTCYGFSDGSIELEPAGGTPPYQILWNNSMTGERIRGLPAGKYKAELTDSNGCRLFTTMEITQPDSISLLQASITHPLCLSRNDGSISIRATGGTPGYRYLWSNGQEGETIAGLTAGRQYVTILDSRQCAALFEFILENQRNPEPELGEDITLCRDATYWLIPGKFSYYAWYYNGKFAGREAMLEAKETGTYRVEVTDEEGCRATDSMTITRSDIAYEARLLVSSKASAGDTLVLIDTSWPVPDSLKWVLPQVKILAETPWTRHCVFPDTGSYEIILTGYYQGCASAQKKKVLILQPDENKMTPNERRTMITRFKIYPNPLRDACTVEIDLNHKHDVQLKIIRIPDGDIKLVKQLKGSDSYLIPLMLPGMLPGIYMIQVLCGDEMKAGMVVVE